MEFNRSNQQGQPLGGPVSSTPAPSPRGGRGKGIEALKGMRIASVVLMFMVTLLVLALIWALVKGSSGGINSAEARNIDKSKMQAVFLNGGQVYFGKISELNNNYLKMSDIFYLRVNQVVQPNQTQANQQAQQNDISLVKLGCELHRPSNEMLINREQVIFWENLKDEAGENTVPGAVKKYLAQYPNGQECQQANEGGAAAPAPATVSPAAPAPATTPAPATRR